MIEAGKHTGKVTETYLSESGKGGAQVCVVFDISGQTITAYLSTSDKAWPYTFDKLRNCGWNPAEFDCDIRCFDEEPSPIVGNEATVVIDHEEFNGKVRPKVGQIWSKGGQRKTFEAGHFDSAAEKLKKAMRAKLAEEGESADFKAPWED